MQEIQEFLNSMAMDLCRINLISSRINDINARRYDLPPAVLNNMPRNPNTSRSSYFENQACLIDDLQQRLLHAVNEYEQKVNLLTRCLVSMDDCTLASIIELRYLDNMDWNSIAQKINYSTRYVFKLHNKALAALEVIMYKDIE